MRRIPITPFSIICNICATLSQLVMQRAGEHFSGAKDSLLTNMIYKKVDPVFFDAMIQILDDPTLDTVQLRGQIDTYERKLSIL